MKKTSLILIALALLLCLAGIIWFLSRPTAPNETAVTNLSRTSGRPAFDVQVEKPRMDRPLGGILPSVIETKLVGELRFNHTSPGATIGKVERDHLELSATGWHVLIITDDKGNVASGTQLVFPIEIAEKLWSMRCRPADPPAGSMTATKRAGTNVLDGSFLVELAKCEDAATGKTLDTEAGGNPGNSWPQSALTLRGIFAGLPKS